MSKAVADERSMVVLFSVFAGLAIVLVARLATCVPVRRATRVECTVALREESPEQT